MIPLIFLKNCKSVNSSSRATGEAVEDGRVSGGEESEGAVRFADRLVILSLSKDLSTALEMTMSALEMTVLVVRMTEPALFEDS